MEWPDIASSRIIAGGYRRQKTYDTFGFILTEELIIPSARMEDIDLGAFRAFLRMQGLDTEEEPQPAIADDLSNRRILTEFDNALCPTLYGLMAFGKEPQAHPQTANFLVECNEQLTDH